MKGEIIIPMNFEQANNWAERMGKAANQLRILLHEGYLGKVWEALGYENWSQCLRGLAIQFNLSERHLWRLHAANESESLLTNWSVTGIPESQLRPLSVLPPEQQPEVWQQAVETAPDGKMTAAHVQDTVSRMYPVTAANHAPSSDPDYDGDEWYTPSEFLDAVRLVMGTIDLDPASCEEAQEGVQAKNYYTKNDDGLIKDWYGNVFINPPFSRDLIQQFVDKLIGEYVAGRVEQAIVLVNNSSETQWFQRLLSSYPACFISGRLAFWRKKSDVFGARQGQACFYLGSNLSEFINVFTNMGIVVSRYDNQ